MTEKEIIQKIYEVIKLVDCMQYNPFVDFNYLRAKGAYNVIKNQVEHIEAENAELRARLSKMETVEKELRERLDNAVELPSVRRDCELTQIVYRNNYGNIEEETYFHDCYYGQCHDVRGDVYAEARLEELKGEKK